jgi:mRNA interferase MazF
MKRGEVWVANLNPSRGREIGKVRPVLVIQSDPLVVAGSPTIAVLPLTTRIQPALKLLRIPLPPRDRLQHACQVIVDQPRTVDRRRFCEGPLTQLTAGEMDAVDRGLRVALGLY